jgi:putative GTP pyrophosphokinase
MTSNFPAPSYSRSQVDKAGEILSSPPQGPLTIEDADKQIWAYDVLSNWRACHNYPINTFQATLRDRLENIDDDATVAQRLKRFPSIVLKLQRFHGMKLARMQDIGGLRAIVDSIASVRKLEQKYRAPTPSFRHKLVSWKDYIANPKADGYRSVHLVYRYQNPQTPAYDGLLLELQLRSRLQHAWATAVETMGTFLGQALKSGYGDDKWRKFFEVSGAALALLEKSPPVPGYGGLNHAQTYAAVAKAESELRVLEKLSGFTIAADKIHKEKGQGSYHLVVLNSSDRSVTITPYGSARLEQANADYTDVEKRSQAGEPVEAVLVSAGPVEALKKAYPNYFLDTAEFIAQIERVIHLGKRGEVRRKRRVTRPAAR